MRKATFAAALACALCATARADPFVAPGISDLVGARALGMAAYRGLPSGNDGIFANAAALAARRRYSVEGQWFLERFGSDDVLQALGASVVDSETGAVTGGMAYTRVMSGTYRGNMYHAAFAFPVGQGLFLGATPKYLSLQGPGTDEVKAVNFDAGAFWQATSLVSIGFAGYNLLNSGHRTSVMPLQVGGGIAIGDERRFHVVGDWRGDFNRKPGGLSSLYAVGGELLVGDMFPVRGGFVHDETRNASFWSTGVGLVTSSGIALDASYRQGIDHSDDRTIAVALKLFLFSS